ncbi:hypothetical protein VTG60DRAFT_3249 [Thermothelomyces hinnuleus]
MRGGGKWFLGEEVQMRGGDAVMRRWDETGVAPEVANGALSLLELHNPSPVSRERASQVRWLHENDPPTLHTLPGRGSFRKTPNKRARRAQVTMSASVQWAALGPPATQLTGRQVQWEFRRRGRGRCDASRDPGHGDPTNFGCNWVCANSSHCRFFDRGISVRCVNFPDITFLHVAPWVPPWSGPIQQTSSPQGRCMFRAQVFVRAEIIRQTRQPQLKEQDPHRAPVPLSPLPGSRAAGSGPCRLGPAFWRTALAEQPAPRIPPGP